MICETLGGQRLGYGITQTWVPSPVLTFVQLRLLVFWSLSLLFCKMGTMMLLMLIKMCNSSACLDYLAYLFVTRQRWQESYPQLSGTHPLSNFCCTGRHSQGAHKAQYLCGPFKRSQVFHMFWNICSRSNKTGLASAQGYPICKLCQPDNGRFRRVLESIQCTQFLAYRVH